MPLVNKLHNADSYVLLAIGKFRGRAGDEIRKVVS